MNFSAWKILLTKWGDKWPWIEHKHSFNIYTLYYTVRYMYFTWYAIIVHITNWCYINTCIFEGTDLEKEHRLLTKLELLVGENRGKGQRSKSVVTLTEVIFSAFIIISTCGKSMLRMQCQYLYIQVLGRYYVNFTVIEPWSQYRMIVFLNLGEQFSV